MIEFDNVSFKYKKGELIFDNLTYSFEKGNIYFILGENGIGKTTLAKLILKILKPIKGEIKNNGIDTITYLPDYNGIYPQLTILENIKYRLALYDLDYTQFKHKIDEMIKLYGIEKYKNMMVSSLSLGTQKKQLFYVLQLSHQI